MLEILASVIILSILMAVLMPTVQTGLKRGREAGCASNLRTIGSYFGLYAADHQGNVLPYVNSANHLWPDIIVWNYISPTASTTQGDYKPFFCPSLETRGYTYESRSPLNYRTTYAINHSVMSSEDIATNKIVRFDKPSRTGVIWDAATWPGAKPLMAVAAGQEYHITAGDPNCSVGWLHGRSEEYPNRRGLANVLFLDGHVEAQPDPGNGELLDIGVQWPNLYP